ncbi:AlkA N-terminal domain-containing protein [Kineobactrum salinum]|uniref:DNA-3-methyladenine glycosylase II n=1 Tax=Kineobactrum salinum TaxID=2708301 RepID=A0A6C0U2W5_9GAMM|nr:AlkA N-terminal domain-containing protein [Kineobactrum salinum]QIB66173.1 DNA-3-methyladenine glycosylase 2 family protein [Kineobactrum salinum]
MTAPLDPEACRLARLARDPRFDGEFFIAVRTTGIYCRPICPARTPAEKNVRYYREAAQAAAAGYRPCLRCRPEAAPGSPAWRGSSVTVSRGLQLIQQGALNGAGSVATLSERLGVGERYLRKLFQRELGVSPQAVAQNARLLFAKQLLAETALPVTDIAFAAGFGSVRRFNSAIQATFKTTPGELRRRQQRRQPVAGSAISLQLQYRPPYDWEGMVDFYRRHAVAGVEQVADDCYRRRVADAGASGWLEVRPLAGRNALQLTLQWPRLEQLPALVHRVRRMFDLDANPAVIATCLGREPALATLLQRFPGIRSPLCWNSAEATIRAIVGQQVSIAAARNVCSRLALATATDATAVAFPEPGLIALLGDEHFPMPGRRRQTLRDVCALLAATPALSLTQLRSVRGIGPWTTAMVAMRGHGDPDILPPRDLGLEKAWQALPGTSGELQQASARWRPWRAYAANLLWRSLAGNQHSTATIQEQDR